MLFTREVRLESLAQELRISAVDLEPTTMSAVGLLTRMSDSANWPEASVHPVDTDFPRLGIEFHPGVGYSILCNEDELSLGFLAATQAVTTEPKVPVNLGGQVVERWPPELFLSEEEATVVINHFFKSGRQDPSFAWVRLDLFERELLHEGAGLIEFWKRLIAVPLHT